MEETEFNAKIVVNFIQRLVNYRVYLPAKQPCTVTSITGLSVPPGYWLHSLVHLLQQLVTECTDRLPASQPYTVVSTGYSVPAEYRLNSLVQLLQ